MAFCPFSLRLTCFPGCFYPQFTRLLVVVFLLQLPVVQAIAASVEGRILDGADGIYLEGARVEIAGTETRTFSERGGYFRIGNLDPGSYTLRVTFAGLPTINGKHRNYG
jgi:hypothetical protein